MVASRSAALARLAAFVPKAGRHYRTERNFDYGPGRHTSVSGLSPYIRHRLIGETEVLRAVLKQHSASNAEKFIQEIFWRAYWKGWLAHRPSVWTHYLEQVQVSLIAVNADGHLHDTYARAQEGLTGIEVFDAWVHELMETGYLHNHSRMWFASIWIFTLKLPWSLGADFFLRHLLDGDPASNTLSWRWVAGLHTLGKTYLATPGNIEKYASGRFFSDRPPEGLARLATFADALPEDNSAAATPLQLPKPVESSARAGLLLTEEDLCLDAPVNPCAVALWITNAMFPLAASELVRAFKADAGEDALSRAQQNWRQLDSCSAFSSVAQITGWAELNDLDEVYVPYIPEGHLRMQVALLTQAMSDAGRKLQFFVRDFDRSAWPHANKGFFHLKKHIPEILETLALN